VGGVNSRGLDSALTGNDTEAGLTSDDADAADPSQGDSQLRRSLLRATAKNARLSAAVLVLATIYVGWLADRFHGSRPLAAALIVVGFAAAVWRWEIGGIGAIDALPNTTMEQRSYRSLDWNAYLICLMWGPATLLVYPSITEVAQAVTYALCAVGSMSVGSMYLLPAAHRGYWALTATHIATFLIASVFIESSRSWATALLLVAYGGAVYRISDQVRRTADKLLKTHQLGNRLRSQAVQREREMLLEAATAARSAQVTEAERQQLFMAKVGHEIRTPAQIIVSDVEFLEHRLAEHPELHTTLRRLRSAADLMSHQMQGVADYARSQSWRADDRVELVRLPTLINDVANLHARAAGAKGLTVRVAAEETELTVDLGKVRQIVENLVGNAIKYTPSGEVTVSANVRNDGQETPELHIVVADTGIGIPDDVQDRVFEPFFRSTPASQRKDGLGLGLAIVKSLVTKLGGRVELQSRAGKGTTVTVTVPLVG
jgi:signal transduction histidine kinase/F0F1-type ATP synthase assembly protein I